MSELNVSDKQGQPVAERPQMSPDYGISKDKEGLLQWDWVSEKMTNARNYWIVSTRPDGRPHAMPVWGVWFEEKFYFSTDPNSRKGRNFATNPEIVVHLESGDDVVIFEGRIRQLADMELISRMGETYFAKYGFKLEPGPAFGIYNLQPHTVYAWLEKDFSKSATRWRFE